MLRLGCVLILLAVCGLGAAPSALPWRIPPVDGEVEGDFKPGAAADTPVLHWKISVRTLRPRERMVEFEIGGAGLRARGVAALDPAGEGTWELREAEINLARWLPIVAATWPPISTAGFALEGTIVASGTGTLRGGVPNGRVQLAWRGGRLDDVAHKVVLEGITADLIVEDFAARRTAPAQVLTWRSGRYDVVEIGAGRAVFALDGEQLRIDEVKIAAFGGEVTLSAMRVSLARPDIEMTARVVGVDAELVRPFFFQTVTAVKGQMDGTVRLSRDERGLHLGPGRLSLVQGSTADVMLKPAPGLLSENLPDSVKKLYTGLADLEAGRVPLRAEVLDVVFDPEGDFEGRTAQARLAGGPVDPRLRAPIDLKINVRGSLDALIKFGTDSRLHWGGGNNR